jgi:hypothetical protein
MVMNHNGHVIKNQSLNTLKLQQLISSLKNGNNKSYQFFEDIVRDLQDDKTKQEGLNKLASCFSITQYANFSFEEEQLLSEIIHEIRR